MKPDETFGALVCDRWVDWYGRRRGRHCTGIVIRNRRADRTDDSYGRRYDQRGKRDALRLRFDIFDTT
jgi:hypothetical protein